jgi:hypothetical protein
MTEKPENLYLRPATSGDSEFAYTTNKVVEETPERYFMEHSH